MKVLTFDIKGKMAHFRKYYSNSSALSYFIPPRTTVTGILAGLIGEPRDSYYDVFSLDNCYITLAVLTPIKKVIQKMNYLHIEGQNDLNGSKAYPSQTPIELVMPQNIRTESITYRVWFSHKDDKIMNKIRQLICHSPVFLSNGISLGLGGAQYLGWIEFVGELIGTQKYDDEVAISSVISRKDIDKIITSKMDKSLYLIKEELPLEFTFNKNEREREITSRGKETIVINLSGYPVVARIKRYIVLNDGTNITWMN